MLSIIRQVKNFIMEKLFSLCYNNLNHHLTA